MFRWRGVGPGYVVQGPSLLRPADSRRSAPNSSSTGRKEASKNEIFPRALRPNGKVNPAQLLTACPDSLNEASTKSRASGSPRDAPSTPTSGLDEKQRRRRTKRNRASIFTVKLPYRNPNYLRKFQLDCRSGSAAMRPRTSRQNAFCLKAPPIGANCL